MPIRYEYDSNYLIGARAVHVRRAARFHATTGSGLPRPVVACIRCSPQPQETLVVPHDCTETHTQNTAHWIGGADSSAPPIRNHFKKSIFFVCKKSSIWGSGGEKPVPYRDWRFGGGPAACPAIWARSRVPGAALSSGPGQPRPGRSSCEATRRGSLYRHNRERAPKGRLRRRRSS